MRPLPHPLRALLLDMDGVLLDSDAVHFAAWKTLLAELGHDLDAAVYAAEVIGRSRDDVLRALLGARDDLPALMDRKERLVLDLLAAGGCPAMPGATDVLDEAYRRGIPVAVATASRMSEPFLRAAGLWDRLPVVRDRNDVARGKPAPDVYLAAASALGTPARSCVAVEDSPSGVRAAIAAGAFTCAIPTTHDPAQLADADLQLPALGALWRAVDAAAR
jgi:HAD superfamily hydrolase (TIGR01509 family)